MSSFFLAESPSCQSTLLNTSVGSEVRRQTRTRLKAPGQIRWGLSAGAKSARRGFLHCRKAPSSDKKTGVHSNSHFLTDKPFFLFWKRLFRITFLMILKFQLDVFRESSFTVMSTWGPFP